MLVSTHGEAGLVHRLKKQRTMFRLAVGLVILVAVAVTFFIAMR